MPSFAFAYLLHRLPITPTERRLNHLLEAQLSLDETYIWRQQEKNKHFDKRIFHAGRGKRGGRHLLLDLKDLATCFNQRLSAYGQAR